MEKLRNFLWQNLNYAPGGDGCGWKLPYVWWRSAGQLFPVPETIIIIFSIMDHYYDRPATTRAEKDEEEEPKWMVVGGGDWILIRLKWKWLVIIILCTCPRRLILRRFQRPRVSLCGHGSHPPSASHRPCDVWLTVCETITTWRWNVVVVVGRGGTGRERIFNISALKHFAQELC